MGRLHIDAAERVAPEDPGWRPRLKCGACFAEFRVPRRLTLEFLLR